MTFAPKFNEPLLPKPSGKPVQSGPGPLKKFVFPVIRGREPSAVDLLAAIVDEKARKRVERQRVGAFPKLMPSDIVGVQPMTGPSAGPAFYRVRHRRDEIEDQ